MKRILFGICALGLLVTLSAQPNRPTTTSVAIQRIPASERTGAAAVVRVADGALVFTGQVGAVQARVDARAEADGALRALEGVLTSQGSGLTRVVRLCAYAADDAAAAAAEAAVAAQFAAAPVAFTLVRTPLTTVGARVVFEAVGVSAREAATVEVADGGLAALLPAGGKIFISGQAQKGTDLAASVQLTMAGLHRSLAHLGLKKTDVVQVKGFIRPFGEHAAARREVAASFDGGPVPPVVLMEWRSELFAEIELVVSARALTATIDDTVSHAWLPWLAKSTRYSHIGHVPGGVPLIFIGAVDGGEAGGSRGQMKLIFERLGSVLFEAGSSYRNLVKATYYLGDAPARAALGEIRGVYFDPLRPPAASALTVADFARPGRTAMIDLIAVPVK